MKNTFIKISKPCNEKWENMVANKNGNYCEVCTKTVIDLTQLNQQEITEIMKKSGKNICVRVTQKQIDTPLLDFETENQYNLPFSKVAATIMITTSLMTTQFSQAENNKIHNLIEQTESKDLKKKRNYSVPKKEPLKPISFKKITGKIISNKGEPIKNAKITFVTTQKLITAYSTKNGTYTLEIPTKLIDDDNVIRISFYEVLNKENVTTPYVYEERDLILSKEDFNTEYLIEANPTVTRLGGGIVISKSRKTPIVIDNGIEINYKDFVKAKINEKSSCSLANKEYLYFKSEIAIAIYGEKAKEGLYILTDK